MEHNAQMNAEQSLNLINETLNNNRRIIAKQSGTHFILWGALLTVMAVIIYFLWKGTGSAAWNLLWFAMPMIGYPLGYLLDKKAGKVPSNMISNLLGWTWSAFGTFAIVLSTCALSFAPMDLTFVIILLFGMAENITGAILKSWPIIISGLLIGVGGAIVATMIPLGTAQMLLFVVAGVVLALTGVVVKCLKK